MCGLVGVAGLSGQGLFGEDVSIFNDLLIVDSVRGNHGTGILSINGKGERKGLKVMGNPYNLMCDKKYESYIDVNKKPYISILAGHNRYATKGGISTETSHPFYSDHISLMHNGTLREYSEFPGKFPVDSASLCNAIAKMGISEAISKMEGAYAIAYFDATEKTFNLARNYERPLWLAFSEKEKTIFWASEKEMLSWVLERRKKNIQFTYMELEANTLFSFPVNNYKITKTNLPITGSKLTKKIINYKFSYFGDYDDDLDFVPAPAVVPITKKKEAPASLTGGGSSYKTGDKIEFFIFDEQEIKGNEKETNPENHRFCMIGTRPDMPETEFRFSLVGVGNKANVYESDSIEATISSIFHRTDKTTGVPAVKVWVNNIKIKEKKDNEKH